MKKKSDKQLLFEQMRKVTGMPLREDSFHSIINEVYNESDRDAWLERTKADKEAWFAQRNINPEDWHDYEGEMGEEEVSYEDYVRETNRPIETFSKDMDDFGKNHFQNMKFMWAKKALGFGDDFRRTYKPEDYYYMVNVQYDIDGDPTNKNQALFGVTRDGSKIDLHAN